MSQEFADNFVFAEFLDVWGPKPSRASPSLTPSPVPSQSFEARPPSVESRSSGYASYGSPSPTYSVWSTASETSVPPIQSSEVQPHYNVQTGYYSQPQYYLCPPFIGQVQYPMGISPAPYSQPQSSYGVPTPYQPQPIPYHPQRHFCQRQANYDVCFCSECMKKSRICYRRQ